MCFTHSFFHFARFFENLFQTTSASPCRILFKPHQLHLAVGMVTDFVSFIYNLKTVF
ncbi:Uncharacterised protein [Streptococcus pneumoniae]|nr:Uncharacterised protein [Streptococcus pneumoniae]